MNETKETIKHPDTIRQEQQRTMKYLPNTSGLIDLATRTLEERREIGRKGGLVSGPTKVLGAKLRELKRRGMTEERAQHLYEVMTSPEYSSLDTRKLIEELKDIVETPKEISSVIKCMNEWHKLKHGQKISIDSEHREINIEEKRLRVEFMFPKSKEELIRDAEVQLNREASLSNAETNG